ncbi:MAG: TIGR04255 family protein [Bacteroidales bacterium]|nr:TIGR04255 family protein [Bacteroidales bacterium]
MKYNLPPIREAIFDLRIDHLADSSIEKLEKIHSLISEIYPNKKKQINFVEKFEFKENKKIRNESDSQVRGFLFSNKDNTCQVQIRLDGFTFNMLKPYSEWNHFSEEALRLWAIYDKNLKPNKITRIALRYINKIEIPISMERFQDYIINMPPIPQCLPQTFRNFFMQIDVPCDNEGTNVIVTETIEKPLKGILPFILDIDVYKTGMIGKTIETLKSEFDNLRNLKNSTFENCITDKTRNLFE